MSLIFQFYHDEDERTCEVKDLVTRYVREGLTPRCANDGLDLWIEFAETNTMIYLNSETQQFSAGRVEISLASLAKDLQRILGPLRELEFTISDEDGDV